MLEFIDSGVEAGCLSLFFEFYHYENLFYDKVGKLTY